MLRPNTTHLLFSVRAELTVGDAHVDLAELKRSLRLIADTASIAVSAQTLGVTYRTLWGRLLAFDAALGCKLVGRARGRGSHLTGKGRALLAALERHDDLFAPGSSARVSALSADISKALRSQPMLRLLSSHDYALANVLFSPRAPSGNAAKSAAVNDSLQDAFLVENAGSVECVRALLRGDADLAGYHHTSAATPLQRKSSKTAELWDRVEQDAEFWSVAVMQREQGLIIAPALKSTVKGLADLLRPDVRFVNRQRGSGTRVLLDSLLVDAGLAASEISGYRHEEFTHQAVAATIAAGAADVGPGLRAAAAQFNLHFVPLAVETYRIAGRSETRLHADVRSLIKALREESKRLPGYKPLSGRVSA
jgi:putative molybdopterin biosynthesis protein